MYKTIEKLYYEWIITMDRRCINNHDVLKANKEIQKMYEQLKKDLPLQQSEQLFELSDALEKLAADDNCDMFVFGFRLGIKLVIESLTEKGPTL